MKVYEKEVRGTCVKDEGRVRKVNELKMKAVKYMGKRKTKRAKRPNEESSGIKL